MAYYVRRTLSEGEHVIMDAKFHWIKYFWTWCIMILSILSVYYIKTDESIDVGYTFISFFVFFLSIYRLLVLLADEVTLTNQRLVAKTGLLSRSTLDLQLSEVESVAVDLPFFPSTFFGTGTIIIRGTGGSEKAVFGIKDILEFRKITQKTLNEKQHNTNTTVSQTVVSTPKSKEEYNAKDRIELLTKLKGLLDAGVISQEEFQMERDRIMGNNS